MKVKDLEFGSINIDGETWEKDVIIENGSVKKRSTSESKKYRERFGPCQVFPYGQLYIFISLSPLVSLSLSL